MEPKYNALLENKEFRRWYENVARGHESTARNYLRCLGKLCGLVGRSPQEIIKMSQRERDDMILDYIADREKNGITGASIKVEIKALKSWLRWNDKRINKPIRIKHAGWTTTLSNESIPSQDELKTIFNAASPQQRTAIALVAFSGLRLEVLGNYNGTDGLRVDDLEGVRIDGETVTFNRVPAMIRVRTELSKTGNSYFTFIGPEGCDYIRAYLESRLRAGEELGDKSPLVAPVRRSVKFITTINIGDIIRRPMRLAGNEQRPYVFRSYFATRSMQAEGSGLLRDWRVFMMGHKGDIEHTYTMNKGRLKEDLIEQMRQGYKAALPFLETSKQTAPMSNSDFLKRMISVLNPKGEVSKADQAELTRLIREKLEKEQNENNVTDSVKSRSVQRVVQISELDNYLRGGYEFVHELPDSRIIVRHSD
ncbi:MAG: site-specific integrase [Thermoplasmata archaeon]|nr:site-specific integrase [Candidatus Sysuiplasma acidicola]